MSKIKGYIEIRDGSFSATSKELADEILAKQDKNRADTVYGWLSYNNRVMTTIKARNASSMSKSITGFDAINVLNKILLDNGDGYLRVVYTDDSDGIAAEWVEGD